ncbi:hypothetical protein [Wolbachia endosymbiont of Psylliodes chrysocephala]|nr:hypothetical protein [Wolbachia endosymbiont of Psylliodes chrysocephala]
MVSELSGRSASEHIGSLDTPGNLRAELVEKQQKQNLVLKAECDGTRS